MQSNTVKKIGISLIVLVITIVVVIILSSTAIISTRNNLSQTRLGGFSNEISEVQDAVNSYYISNNILPIKDEVITKAEVLNKVSEKNRSEFENEINLNGDNTAQFYKVDTDLIEVTMSDKDNIKEYILSYPNFNIYDIKGIKVDNNIYFSLSSKINGIVKVNNQEENSSNVTTKNGASLKVVSNTLKATNQLGIKIDYSKESSDKMYLILSDIGRKEVQDSNNSFTFNSLEEINDKNILISSLTVNEIETFNLAKNKTIDVEITRNDNVIAKESLDVSNYDNQKPTLELSENNLYENMRVIRLNTSDDLSGIKEIRYDYLKKTDRFGSIVDYYEGISSFDDEYMKTKSKVVDAKQIVNGQVDLKIPMDVCILNAIAIDNAGNISNILPISYTSGIACSITASPIGSITSAIEASRVTYTFTFSESVIGFTDSDINIENGVMVSFSGTGKVYTLVVDSLPNTEAIQRVSINEGVCTNVNSSARNFAASMQLKVNSQKYNIEPQGISLNKSNLTLLINNNEKLIPTITPANVTDNTIKWTSSNPSVAEVNPYGLVTAKSEGTAIITVTTINNKRATCTVDVTKGVARIGSNYYATLQEAFDVASTTSSAPSTIELLKNVTLTGQATFASGKYATLNMNGYNIACSTSNVYTLNNAGTLTLQGTGTISNSSYRTVNNIGTLNLNGPTISQTGSYYAVYISAGEFNVNSGNITSASANAIYKSGGTLRIGDSSSTLSTTSPLIQSTGTAGVYNSSGTMYFYSGKVVGKTNAISGTAPTPRSGYSVVVNLSNGTETATLGRAVARIGSKNYTTLQNAFNAISSSATVYLLSNTAETVTLASGKTANLYLQGYTLSSAVSATPTITNNGILNVYGSGTITSSADMAINNIGTLTINSSAYIKTTASGKPAVTNTGKVTLNSGIVSSESSSNDGSNHGILNNSTTATLEVKGGTIKGYDGVKNLGIINMSGGEIHSNSDDAIEFYSGTITITGGSITGNYGIWNNGSTSKTLTIGVNDGSVSTTSPVIEVSNTAINNSSTTFNFYDGKISGGSGPINDINTVNTPTGYGIFVNTVNGKKVATLGMAVAKIGSTNYETLQAAFDAASTTSSSPSTIMLLKNVTATNTCTFASGKYATLNMNGYNITGSVSDIIIKNYGNLNLMGVSGGNNTIKNTNVGTIRNEGTMTLSNITIDAGGNTTVDVYGDGSLTVNSGTKILGNTGIYCYSGTITINDGIISGATDQGATVLNSSTLIMKNGSITGNSNGIWGPSINAKINMEGGTVTAINNSGISSDGTITVTGGSVTGIYSSGTITLGKNDGSVSTTSPIITKKKDGEYGVYNNGGTFNFYDGKISGGSTAIYNYDSVNKPSGYKTIVSKENNIETVILGTTAVARIGNKYYTTLQKTFDSMNSGSTVYLLSSITESTTLASGKTASLYLQGYTLSSSTSATPTITNNGTLNVYGSGTITSSAYRAINNVGTLTINSSANIKTTATGNPVINNTGKTTLNSGTVSAESSSNNSSNHGILNNSTTATLEVKGGTIKGYDGVRNLGTINMTGGEIHSNNDDAIEFYSGTITITGGSITGKYGIYTGGSGPRTLTLGTNDSTVSTTSPVINVTNTAVSNSSITTYFYDGKVTGSTQFSNKTSVTVPTGYQIVVSGTTATLSNT